MSSAVLLISVLAIVGFMSSGNRQRFKNLDGSGSPKFLTVIRWQIFDTILGRRRFAPKTAPVQTTMPQLARIARAPQHDESAQLTWIGHASWLVQIGGKSLLIDPIFGELPGPGQKRNVAAGLSPANLPVIDAILITHSHYDHLDIPSIKRVASPVIAGTGMKELFACKGLSAVELEWWQSLCLDSVKITFVPAQHWSRRSPFDANNTLWGGFVIECGTTKIYHAGDSAYFSGFAEIGRRFPAIDAALLPIGAYDPAWFMLKSHMNPVQAVQAFIDLGARHLYAMHWGTFKLSDEPLDEPPQLLVSAWQQRALPNGQMHVLAVGETVDIRHGC